MLRAAALACAVLALGACGYGEDNEVAGGPNPRAAFDRFATAVLEDDSGAATNLVSRELDEDERESFVEAVRSDLEPLGGGYRVIFDRRLSDGLAVVAAQGNEHPRPGALAFVVVRDGKSWFVEPNRLDLVYGASAVDGTSARKPVVDFRVNGDQRPQGRMWLDDREVRLREDPPGTFRAGVRLLERRLYSTVAYAEAGDRRSAIAWTFEAR